MKKNYDLEKMARKPGKKKIDPEATRIMISLKMDANVLGDMKTEAERLGMPYQTLINSVLHRFINGEFVDIRDLKNLKLG